MFRDIKYITFEHNFLKSGLSRYPEAIIEEKGRKLSFSKRKNFFLIDKDIFKSKSPCDYRLKPFFDDKFSFGDMSKLTSRYFESKRYFNLEKGKKGDCCFWNPKNCPKEILDKLKNPEEFEKNWGKTFSFLLSSTEIFEILDKGSRKWKEYVWDKMIERKNRPLPAKTIKKYYLTEINGLLEFILLKINLIWTRENNFPLEIMSFLSEKEEWTKFCLCLMESKKKYGFCRTDLFIIFLTISEKWKEKTWKRLKEETYLSIPDIEIFLNIIKGLKKKKIKGQWIKWTKRIMEKFFSDKGFSDCNAGEILEIMDRIKSIRILGAIHKSWKIPKYIRIEAINKIEKIKRKEKSNATDLYDH